MKLTNYDDKTLKHLQNLELKIFKDFIKICEDNNLKYYLYGGSLLGAIRHGGFIPWDDDLDLIMFRSDYEKLNDILVNNYNEKYLLLNNNTEPEYFYLFSKFMLKNTQFEEEWISQVNFHIGINVDIFVLDNLNKNKFKSFYQLKKTFLYNKLMIMSKIKLNDLPTFSRWANVLLYSILNFFKLNPRKIYNKYLNFLNKYGDEESNLVFDNSAQAYPQIFEKNDFEPSIQVKFEDINVNIPKCYDKILTSIYGDYMQLTKKEKRYNHPIDNLDFGKY